METAQGVVVYTQDDLNNAVANAKTMGKQATIDSVCSDVKDIFRGEVTQSNMERDYATTLYNTIAEKVGGSTVSSIGGLYTVEITYDSDVIMVVNDIEADDEDEACDTVRDGVSVDDVALSFTISYNGDYEQVETSYDRAYRIETELDFSATEQD